MSYSQWTRWNLFRDDADYLQLAKFLDQVMRGGGDWRGGCWWLDWRGGGNRGRRDRRSAGAFQLPAWTIAFPFVAGSAASVAPLIWYFRTKPRHDPAMRMASRDLRAVVWRL